MPTNDRRSPVCPFKVIGRPGRRHVRIRFSGSFEGAPVTWDAVVVALDPASPDPQYIEIGAARRAGRNVRIGLRVPALDEPTLHKAVIMMRNYKRLRVGRHEFALPKTARLRLVRVVSGGQTGVDRAALDAALALGIACGGWCPRGRRAEDGAIPARYPLTETRTADYRLRTRRNVLDADATLILTRGALRGGTAYTLRVARRAHRPSLVVDLASDPAPAAARDWLAAQRVETLNVAGPRESNVPGIHGEARAFLRQVFARD